VTSRSRQREQAEALVRGHGQIVAELFDVAESRTVAWARRPQAAALVAQLADPDRGWDAVVREPTKNALTRLQALRPGRPAGAAVPASDICWRSEVTAAFEVPAQFSRL
jgi:hypothetical protein